MGKRGPTSPPPPLNPKDTVVVVVGLMAEMKGTGTFKSSKFHGFVVSWVILV